MIIEWSLLLVGFGLGFIHALDADHVMAVSVLNSQNPGLKKSLFHSAHWALGHGGVLLFAGVLLFGLGITLPENLQKMAEASVGLLLIVLGLLCFLQFRKEKITLREHRHGDVVHTHWQNKTHRKKSSHQPVLIGALHGLAGSAPALALLPAVINGQLSLAIIYLILFSIGVMLSMLMFSVGFGFFQHWLRQNFQTVFHYSRHLIALVSIFLGGFWLYQAV